MRDSLVDLLQMSIEIERARRGHPSGKEKRPMTVQLTHADRCDACGVAALYRVSDSTERVVLDYCGHHWRKHSPAMPGWHVTGVNSALVDA